jgi:integrase
MERFRMYKRRDRGGGMYYWEDKSTGQQGSLKTKDRSAAAKLLDAKNSAGRNTFLDRELGRAYLGASDPTFRTRTWSEVIEAYCGRPNLKAPSVERAVREFGRERFTALKAVVVTETTATDIFGCATTASAAHYLKRLHNYAVALGWLPWQVMPPQVWPKFQTRPKRRITADEHQRILVSERHIERRRYYEMLWLTGGSQKDVAELTRDNVDEHDQLLYFGRSKTDALSALRVSRAMRNLLDSLPPTGSLFPTIAVLGSNERSSEFARRCRLTGISGVSLHSYRYSWAQRAKIAGYPERYAQIALGHGSKAVARAYAREGLAILPSLEEYEGDGA